MVNSKTAILQLRELERLSRPSRLAAEEWKEDWKTLIATLMSARTTDKKTIPVAEQLFQKYKTVNSLAGAGVRDIERVIRPVNFYKTKSRNIFRLSRILANQYEGRVPHDFSRLIELPGVGRKTANVFLAGHGHGTIGADTHVSWISRQMGWTKSERQERIENDLKRLFPEKYWGKVNGILVRFGQTYRSRAEKIRILGRVKKEIGEDF